MAVLRKSLQGIISEYYSKLLDQHFNVGENALPVGIVIFL